MAFITVGIDTSRVYNRKQPPGGQCADLFGGHPDISTGGGGDTKNRRLNRLMSNVEVGSEKEVVEQPRVQRKSQPSVCPVTGENIGHNMPAIQPVNKTEAREEIVKQEESTVSKKEIAVEAVKTDIKAKPEKKTSSHPEAEPASNVTYKEPAKPSQEVSQNPEVSTVKEQSASPVSAEIRPATQQHKAADLQQQTSLPPPSTPTLVESPSPSPDHQPVMTSPAPAAVKTRRVPPGGHTTAFW